MNPPEIAIPLPFSPTAPLAPRTLVEASAGTGKTHALCGLVTYLIGSGTTINGAALTVEDFLVVTFTNLSTEDLKTRIRQRLTAVRDELTHGAMAHRPSDHSTDEVTQALRHDAENAIRRLNAAIADFANLSVSTIHGFAQSALTLIGAIGGVQPDLPVIRDDSDMLDDAISDELAAQAFALGLSDDDENADTHVGATNTPNDDIPTAKEMSWIPSAHRVRKVIRTLASMPDIVVRPFANGAPPTFSDLVAAQQIEYERVRAEVLNDYRNATKIKDRADALAPLTRLTEQLDVVRSGWIALGALSRATDRRRQSQVRNYQDLLTDLRDVVCDDHSTAAQRLRDRYRIALIDEFQDTDRVQWDIFNACFGIGDASKLVVVGDPKQAIYRFRGADVHTYAHVAAQAVTRYSLETNYRSDGTLLHAIETLLRGVSFGTAAPFRPVSAAPGHQARGIRWRDDSDVHERALAPLRIVTQGLARDPSDGAAAQPEPKHNATSFDDDLIDWIRHLRAHAQIRTGADASRAASDPPDDAHAWRDVAYDDIALLVTTNPEVERLQQLLRRHKIPAVVYSETDVRDDPLRSYFDNGTSMRRYAPSDAAWNWQLLLEAIAHPTDAKRARAATATIFAPAGVEWTAVLHTPTDADSTRRFELFQEQLADWAKSVARNGPSSLVARLRAETPWMERAAMRDDADRFMTDVGHIAELFATTTGDGPLSIDEMLAVLATDNDETNDTSLTSRRLSTDDPSVTIMTLHKAKGLQFPIVGFTGLHESRKPQSDRTGERSGSRFHDPDANGGIEVLDLEHGETSLDAEWSEQTADDLRKLYVALTRGMHHVFTYWKDPASTRRIAGPLTRVLFERSDDGTIDQEAFHASGQRRPDPAPRARVRTPETDAAVLSSIVGQSLFADPHGGSAPTIDWVRVEDLPIRVDDATQSETPSSPSNAPATTTLTPATLGERRFVRHTRQWSFSAIESARKNRDDDNDAPTIRGTDEPAPAQDGLAVTSGGNHDLAQLRAGAGFGTFVHEILQDLDFAADVAATRAAIEAHPNISRVALARNGASTDGVQELARGLHRALHAPLGPFASNGGVLHLSDIATHDRLTECDFDLRLDTLDDGPSTGLRIGEILVRSLDRTDPYFPWAQELAAGRFDMAIAGYLTGSIDLIYRVHHGASAGAEGTDATVTRFHISDYKTNENRNGDYSPGSLVQMMTSSDYPLQALLYQVALHRYLRGRLPGYDPAVNLGATTYLFVRGMTDQTSDDVPEPPGVARWDIPTAVVTDLDALFAGNLERIP